MSATNKPNGNTKKPRSRTVKVDYIARVEGEGALDLRVRGGKVVKADLRIFEPPRFFEAFLRGRRWTEAPDITARICGICPVAYQSSACAAMESIAGITIHPQVRALRRLLYCGEWIESHILHMAMLHLPDFLGYQDAIQMAEDHPEVVKKALRIKKLGNDLMTCLGGREIHPISMRAGGLWQTPDEEELAAFLPELGWAKDAVAELAEVLAGLDYPAFERDYEFVAMRHPDEYAITEGRIVSSKGIDIPIEAFFDTFEEIHVKRSTSLQSVVKGRGAYHVGPLARINLNYEQLHPECHALAKKAGLEPPLRNPFKSLLARGLEVMYAVCEAETIIRSYQRPECASVDAVPKAGQGFGCSEAPRGICLHRYAIDEDGVIQEARIAPPTAQNQLTIEEDLAALAPMYLDAPGEELTWRCEQAIRNYDPCISCSCHFLDVTVHGR